MRAKLRGDLKALADCEGAPGTCWTDVLIEQVAGRSLAVENVTVHVVTLRLPRTLWRTRQGAKLHYSLGVTLLSVPHEWLWKDVTKDEWTAYQTAQRGLR
jgi:hypothetical protein